MNIFEKIEHFSILNMLIFNTLPIFCLFLLVGANFDFGQNLNAQWANYKQQFGKNYPTIAEDLQRKEMFAKSLQEIASVNAVYGEGYLSLTKFSTNTDEENEKLMFSLWRNDEKMKRLSKKNSVLPSRNSTQLQSRQNAEVDWRSWGYVTPVKNQGQCGSCWAFAVTASLESQSAFKNRRLYSLSDQHIMECYKQENSDACNGGVPLFAYYRMIRDNANPNGINQESCYPYTEKDSMSCRPNPNCNVPNTKVRDVTNWDNDNWRYDHSRLEDTIRRNGPVVVSVDASGWGNWYHKRGDKTIFDGPCYYEEYAGGHAVVAVGFGRDFWILKNSWGTDWGDGYIYIRKGKCVVGSENAIPIV